MSRIGKLPISVPSGVDIKLTDTNITVKGPKGCVECPIHPDITVKFEDGVISCERHTNRPEHRSLHGLTRALINNAVVGVTDGFSKTLEIHGVGYRCEAAGKNVKINVGYSNENIVEPLEGIEFEVIPGTRNQIPTIIVKGYNKETVGQQAALIRKIRPPEPYKGKGIRYKDEVVRRKVGKQAKK